MTPCHEAFALKSVAVERVLLFLRRTIQMTGYEHFRTNARNIQRLDE